MEGNMYVESNIFICEQFRGYFRCSSCASRLCVHTKLAEQLEENYQINNSGEKPGSCFFCGRIAPERNGIAICARCAS